ncbi:rRNA maturation RNase YbeY [Acetobacter estunensis]|uniref:rRNA maturation RNase YbeY n=1 Tax=Acetobacter estunensis TaxID=104097 RepID=UPI001C2DC6CD|nr:rRNA maturation RNase YbeY [Acetobacter estunensis]MBV1837650.1 rRNA maturation RNase YbeY [Acetobacter estunensis]
MEPPSSSTRAESAGADPDPSHGNGSFFSPFDWGIHHAESDGDPEIIVEDRRWRGVVPAAERLVRRACAASLRGRTPGGAPLAPPESIVLSSDRVVKRLNDRHRGRNKPTNVLTFEPPAPGLPGGEIILAFETVCREAQAARKPVAEHLAHLIAHGILHLGGHDHHQAGEARRMEMEETRVLATLGVPNPWKPRI